jgi:hypothetical protein
MQEKTMTYFGQQVQIAYKNRGFVGLKIHGRYGKGKTTSAMWLTYAIYRLFYPSESIKQIWQRVLDSFVFTAQDFLKLTDTRPMNKDWLSMRATDVLQTTFKMRHIIIIWDDAGIHASKEKRYEQDIKEVTQKLNTIRDVTSCLIITVPEEGELVSSLRDNRSFITVEIHREGGGKYNRRLYFWEYRFGKLGRRRRKFLWKSKIFSIYVPNWVYGKYLAMRNYAKELNDIENEKYKKVKQIESDYLDARRRWFESKLKDIEAKIKKGDGSC